MSNETEISKRHFAKKPSIRKKRHFSEKSLTCGELTLFRNDAFVANLRVYVSSNAHPWPERNLKFKVCSFAESCEKISCKILNKKIGKSILLSIYHVSDLSNYFSLFPSAQSQHCRDLKFQIIQNS